jgi:homoserine kinase type II
MAVFTPVSRHQLESWLARYPVGALVSFEGIASGIENSNFFVETDAGRWVLTLFERLPADKLPFYLELMRHLASHGIACPDPVTDREGALHSMLAGRPAALVTRLRGSGVTEPVVAHCVAVGRLLGQMHLAARDYPGTEANARGLPWWEKAAPDVMPFLTSAQAELLQHELALQQAFALTDACRDLPRSAVHADLFRDNVLFEGETLGGVIDFYFAGVDTWIFDLAVTCNDWCIDDASGAFDDARLTAMLQAYQVERPLLEIELAAWPLMLRAAALRFWLSRLHDFHLPRPAETLTPKDPNHFERILRDRAACADSGRVTRPLQGATECR